MARHQPHPCKRQACRHHKEQRGQNSPHPALVEFYETEPSLLKFRHEDGGDEISADDKKYVDTDEAATEHRETGVKQDYRPDGDGAQSIYFRTIAQASPANCRTLR